MFAQEGGEGFKLASDLRFIRRDPSRLNYLLGTIPITVASTERSFLKLKLIKSYLRSTMLQDRLNRLTILIIN
jgi:hypothetical protein